MFEKFCITQYLRHYGNFECSKISKSSTTRLPSRITWQRHQNYRQTNLDRIASQPPHFISNSFKCNKQPNSRRVWLVKPYQDSRLLSTVICSTGIWNVSAAINACWSVQFFFDWFVLQARRTVMNLLHLALSSYSTPQKHPLTTCNYHGNLYTVLFIISSQYQKISFLLLPGIA